MKNHTKVYFNHFGHQIIEDVFCENCGKPAGDIHHLENRGMGGSKSKDLIENLMALCRECHSECHNSKEFNKEMKIKHKIILNS